MASRSCLPYYISPRSCLPSIVNRAFLICPLSTALALPLQSHLPYQACPPSRLLPLFSSVAPSSSSVVLSLLHVSLVAPSSFCPSHLPTSTFSVAPTLSSQSHLPHQVCSRPCLPPLILLHRAFLISCSPRTPLPRSCGRAFLAW